MTPDQKSHRSICNADVNTFCPDVYSQVVKLVSIERFPHSGHEQIKEECAHVVSRERLVPTILTGLVESIVSTHRWAAVIIPHTIDTDEDGSWSALYSIGGDDCFSDDAFEDSK